MVQFNLLPDVKKEYIKTKRTKRLITSASFFVAVGFVAVTILLLMYVRLVQTKSINDLTKDIKKDTAQLNSTEGLTNKLTVQNQLTMLTELHEKKPEVSRVFKYVQFFTPESTQLLELKVDTDVGVMTISGTISTLAEANKLVENIKSVKYASYSIQEQAPEQIEDLVYEVTESTVSSDGAVARFEIDIEYQKDIFDNTQNIVMQLLDQKITVSGKTNPNTSQNQTEEQT